MGYSVGDLLTSSWPPVSYQAITASDLMLLRLPFTSIETFLFKTTDAIFNSLIKIASKQQAYLY